MEPTQVPGSTIAVFRHISEPQSNLERYSVKRKPAAGQSGHNMPTCDQTPRDRVEHGYGRTPGTIAPKPPAVRVATEPLHPGGSAWIVQEEAGGQTGRMRSQTRTSNQTTCSVLASALPGDKRPTNVHTILLGYGKWTQYSLFECFLTRKQLVLLRSKLEEHLVARQDSVRFSPLCANCVSKVETVGGPPPADAVLFVV